MTRTATSERFGLSYSIVLPSHVISTGPGKNQAAVIPLICIHYEKSCGVSLEDVSLGNSGGPQEDKY